MSSSWLKCGLDKIKLCVMIIKKGKEFIIKIFCANCKTPYEKK